MPAREQGRRATERPARVLLQIGAKYPEGVWDTIRPRLRERAARGDQGRFQEALAKVIDVEPADDDRQ
jgi:hypothetical protein